MSQIRIGTRIEREHKDTYKFIKRYINKYGTLPSERTFFKSIAKSHIKEDPFYYKKLMKCKL